jgi:hypothetical protein
VKSYAEYKWTVSWTKRELLRIKRKSWEIYCISVTSKEMLGVLRNMVMKYDNQLCLTTATTRTSYLDGGFDS